MFDRVIVNNEETEFVPYAKEVTIHEHRAPTDESIKIYDELRKKAIRSVVGEYTVKNEIIEGCIVEMMENDMNRNIDLVIKVKINGKVLFATDKISCPESMSRQLYMYSNKQREKILIEKFNDLLTSLIRTQILSNMKIKNNTSLQRG